MPRSFAGRLAARLDLHPYDGVTRVFTHQDADPGPGLELVSRLLGGQLPASPTGLVYRLSFYSGGLGVIDRLSVSLGASREQVDRVVQALRLVPWEVARTGDEIRWLLDADDHPGDDRALEAFLAQQGVTGAKETWFEPNSGVNSWTVVAWTGDALHLHAHDQG